MRAAVSALGAAHRPRCDARIPAPPRSPLRRAGKLLVGDPSRKDALALQRLDASANDLGRGFLGALCEALAANRVLQQLRVHDNRFGRESGTGAALGKAVAACPSLEALTVTWDTPPAGASGGKRPKAAAGKRGAAARGNDQAFVLALPKSRLRALALCGAALSPQLVPSLAASLGRVTHLDLTGGMLGHKEICALADVLRPKSGRRRGGSGASSPKPAESSAPPTRKRGGRAASQRGNGASSPPKLVTLVLRDNDVGTAAARALFAAAATCPTLTHLDVSYNRIDGGAVAAIARCVRQAPQLARIDLGCNAFANAEAGPLVEAVRETGTLVSVGNLPAFDGTAGVALSASVQANRRALHARSAAPCSYLDGCVLSRVGGDPNVRSGADEDGEGGSSAEADAGSAPAGQEGIPGGVYALQLVQGATVRCVAAKRGPALTLAAYTEAAAVPRAHVHQGLGSMPESVLGALSGAPCAVECCPPSAGHYVLACEARIRRGGSATSHGTATPGVEAVRRFLWQVRVAGVPRRSGVAAHGGVVSTSPLGGEGREGALRTALPWGCVPAGTWPDSEQMRALRAEACRASDTRHPLWEGTAALGVMGGSAATKEVAAAVAQSAGRLTRQAGARGRLQVEEVLAMGEEGGAPVGAADEGTGADPRPFVRLLVPIGPVGLGEPVGIHLLGGSPAAGDAVEVRALELWRKLRQDEEAAIAKEGEEQSGEGRDPQAPGTDSDLVHALAAAEEREGTSGSAVVLPLWGDAPFDAEACGLAWGGQD